jgi:DNA-binding NarL/FixJ family response regulator
VIIDSKKFRQAELTHLLQVWAAAMGLTVSALVPDTPLENCCTRASCAMVVFNLGSASIKDAQCQELMKSVHTLIPEVPLVIISDREEPQEVCAAFEQGAVGFMPTSTEPTVVFQALSFIKGGGSFFPPSALSYICPREAVFDRRHPGSVLTSQQDKVLVLLGQGQSNKVIARELGMAEATVKVHVRRIMHKFGVANRTQLAIAAISESANTNAAHNQADEAKELRSRPRALGDQAARTSTRTARHGGPGRPNGDRMFERVTPLGDQPEASLIATDLKA